MGSRPGDLQQPSYEDLVALVAEQALTIRRLEGEIVVLRVQVVELKAQGRGSSKNSSRPPSSDGLGKVPAKDPKKRSLRKASGKKPGGQEGHKGARLDRVAVPDHLVEHEPERCEGCQGDLAGAQRLAGGVSRQVFDVPQPRLEVTEHTTVSRRCTCGHVSCGRFPKGVSAPTQYGPRVRAMGVYLHVFHYVPVDRTCLALEDLIGASCSPGTLSNWVHGAAAGLDDFDERVRQLLYQEPVIGLDETGARIAGRLHWIHSASTSLLTRYTAHRRRGCEAINAAGVLPDYTGTAVHDGWKPYMTYTTCKHGLCNPHHLRELVAAAEAGHAWPQQMTRLLLDTNHDCEHARQHGASELAADILTKLASDYEQLIQSARTEHPDLPGKTPRTKAHNLLLRLDTQRADVLRFAHDIQVPFGNNQSEQDIRMAKLQQKISGCFRTLQGAERFLRIRSYLSTARKHTLAPLHVLNLLNAGNPWMPPSPAPT